MKNLFSVNMNDEGSDALNTNPFVLRRVDPEFSKKMEELFDSDEEDGEESEKTPASEKILRTLRIVCGYFSFIMLAGMIKALPKAGAEAFIKVPWITATFVVCGIVFLVLTARKIRNDKAKTQAKETVEEDEAKESEDYEETLKKITEEAYAFLKIPASAQSTDIFVRLYKIKNGKETNGSSLFQFMNTEHKIFLEDRLLCLADAESVLAIPTENITGIDKVDQRIKFFGWNKEEEYRSDRYKPYQIKQRGFALTVKSCYALRFHSDFGEDYEILFPAYELDTWTALTGIDVKDAP